MTKSTFYPTEDMGSLEHEFWSWHHENPHVYMKICEYADKAIRRRGYSKWSISAIVEVIRWESGVVTQGEEFKIPNNHRAWFARLWLRDHPRHQDFFQLNEQRSLRVAKLDRFGRTENDEGYDGRP